jgi:hypothetical protein
VGRELPAGNVPIWIIALVSKSVYRSWVYVGGAGALRIRPTDPARKDNHNRNTPAAAEVGQEPPTLPTLRTREGEYHEGLRWTDSQS